jgi:hypothetical protein
LKKYLLLFAASLALQSCLTKMALRYIGALDKEAKEKRISNEKKELVFIPMHHVGKPEFYDHVKRKIDSLHQLGYVVFYEQVIPSPQINKQSIDISYRKYRKIVGSLHVKGYLNEAEGTVLGRKMRVAKQLVNQPFGKAIGLDSTIDLRVDAYLQELIENYENKYDLVQLTDCDFKTAFTEKYKCEKIKNKEALTYFTRVYRNQLIADKILASTYTKIVLLYGANHYEGILSNLKKADTTWQEL